MSEHKITTHQYNKSQFTARVDGRQLVGDKGFPSLFFSRAEARAEAQRRIDLEDKDKETDLMRTAKGMKAALAAAEGK